MSPAGAAIAKVVAVVSPIASAAQPPGKKSVPKVCPRDFPASIDREIEEVPETLKPAWIAGFSYNRGDWI